MSITDKSIDWTEITIYTNQSKYHVWLFVISHTHSFDIAVTTFLIATIAIATTSTATASTATNQPPTVQLQ